MTQPSAAALIETYLAKLRIELDSVGAVDVDDLVAEVRSMLVDAAGEDAERASAEIDRLGAAEELAAGILAERGLESSAGVATAEWWRLGVAAPVDIAVGLSVPLAMFVVLFRVATATEGPWLVADRIPALLAGIALMAGALYWPWWVWRPWREGGLRSSAGMAVTGISVVRAPGFRRIVRIKDLAALGLRPAERGVVSGWLSIASAAILLAFAASAALGGGLPGPDSDSLVIGVGPAASQEADARLVVGTMYADMLGGRTEAATRVVADAALPAYERLAARVSKDKVEAFSVTSASMEGTGVWAVGVQERSPAGERTLTVSAGLRVIATAQGETRDWVVTDIREGTP